MGSKARHWCFTLNNPETDILDFDDQNIIYAIYQLEIAPETGTVHFQGYIVLKVKQRLTWVRSILPRAHWEVARGTPQQNRDYCTKPDTRIGEPFELGVFPEDTGQGARTDLKQLHSALKDGLTNKAYSENFFGLWLRYPHVVTNYQQAQIVSRTSSQETVCTLIIGNPGTGKSRYAERLAREYGLGPVFRKQRGKWWDGYLGERVVIFDDFRGSSLSFTDFKLIVDRYPLRVEVKGSHVDLAATHFIITTNIDPDQWWKEEVTGPELSAVTRRFTAGVLHFALLNSFVRYPTYEAYRAGIAPTLWNAPQAQIQFEEVHYPPMEEEEVNVQ